MPLSELTNLSPLGYGAAPLGNVYGDVDRSVGVRSVRRAIDLGVTFFDVSPSYGRTLAEEVLGEALARHRKEIVLCTKAGRYGKDAFDFSAERIARSVNESLRRLRTDYLDILLIHDIERGLPEQIVGETIDALERVKQEGKCRFIGVSGYPLYALEYVMEARDLDVVMSYCHYCLFNTQLVEQLLPVAERRGTALINASPLGMGLLSDDGLPPWHPASRSLKAACRHAAALCHARGARLADLALQFALRAPGVLTTVVGMPTSEQVEQNVAACRAAPDEALLTKLQEIFAEVTEVTWPSGLPDWEGAPGGYYTSTV